MLATGYYSVDKDGNKEYEDERGPITSGFYQHGLNKHWTASAYAQGNKNTHCLEPIIFWLPGLVISQLILREIKITTMPEQWGRQHIS